MSNNIMSIFIECTSIVIYCSFYVSASIATDDASISEAFTSLPPSKPILSKIYSLGQLLDKKIPDPPPEYGTTPQDSLSNDTRYRIDKKKEDWARLKNLYGVVLAEFPLRDNKPNFKRGTGMIIGPNVVLTAAHVVREHSLSKREQDSKSITFYPCAEGQQCLGAMKITSEHCYIPPDFESSDIKNVPYDYALLFLQYPIGNYTGWFGLAWLSDKQLEETSFEINGYPNSKSRDEYQLWGDQGKIMKWVPESYECKVDLLTYSISTSKGQSGGGVIFRNLDGYYIVGIHHGETNDSKEKVAIRITQGKYQEIWTLLSNYANSHPPYTSFDEWKKDFQSLGNLDSDNAYHIIEYLNDKTLNITLKGYNPAIEGFLQIPPKQKLPIYNLEVKYGKKLKPRLMLLFNQFTIHSSLSLIDSGIDDEDIRLLYIHFRDYKKQFRFTTLSLKSNYISNLGANYLAMTLQFLNISTLFLSDNQIGDDGLIKIAEELPHSKLKTLYLNENMITKKGAKLLIPYLNHPESSTIIYLDDNYINKDDKQALASYLLRAKL